MNFERANGLIEFPVSPDGQGDLRMDRRSVMSGGIAAVALFAGPIPRALSNEQPKVFRIGYQKNGVLLVAKQQKLIEKCLERLGISVR
jgi:ABC-type nitrate/sulfonate/bicarbonate transport system substrate-binding protein